ncbi:MAG: DUF397 domain-containing protein [Pseudonocardiales bacterium]|nr:DUF397 domain-containing protein [Pseudonocardiales bacterium]MBV9030737.1 DUF397 domain-containing protein [Pseudonocardiales bacterium]MBW0008511.1 DUF397 domain-containing protein [Pseudonocardiales bacterium]
MRDLRNAQWRTPSRSYAANACVEVAGLPGGHRAVRDSKDRSGPALVLAAAEWTAFTTGVRAASSTDRTGTPRPSGHHTARPCDECTQPVSLQQGG